jgi:hypothetical protein
MGRVRRLATFIVLFSLAAPVAVAWEADVHYGLTKWLAIQIGYRAADAETIAAANQNVDDSWITSPIVTTVVGACLSRFGIPNDSEASVGMQRHHFPSKLRPPRPPSNRIVDASKLWRDQKIMPRPKLDSSKPQLEALGSYLHTLQDTWSHQGKPDVPPLCDNDLGWGHPGRRGGWTCHLADQTHWWEKHALEMAQATYSALAAARKQKPRVTWKKLEPDVKSFGAAKSKWEKDKWFEARGFDKRGFLQAISLPDCRPEEKICAPYKYDWAVRQWNQIVSNDRDPQFSIPAPFLRIFDQAFTAIVTQNVGMLRELVWEPAIADSLARAAYSDGACPQLYGVMLELYFGKRLASGLSGQQPAPVCELIARMHEERGKGPKCDELLEMARKELANPQKYGPSIGDMGPMAFRRTIVPGQAPGTYLAFGRFNNVPASVLVLGAGPVPGVDQPRITTMAWLPLR